jgi:hypothetical protein
MGVHDGLGTAWSKLSCRPAVRRLVNLGFHLHARTQSGELERADPIEVQARTLRRLLRRARATRFGRDHGFDRIRSVAEFQRRVPIRTYESLWAEYLRERYPVFEDLTWPGRIPFLALTSGTTRGPTKYIPVSAEMVASNRRAAATMLALHCRTHPNARLFRGRLFFLGGSTDLRPASAGVSEGDLSGIVAAELSPFFRPYTFPGLELALETDWDRKLSQLAELSQKEPISLVGGVPSWLLMLFQKLLEQTGKETLVEVWPNLELVVHGGVKFDPYRATFRSIVGSARVRLLETYACSEGFVAFGDPATELLRLVFDHGLFYEFVPATELGSVRPTRHWLGTAVPGVNYALVVSTCAGMWAHSVGDTIRFESLGPPLLTFTGRTEQTLSAFGEHLINEELEAAVTSAAASTSAAVRDWHVGPVFAGALGYHQYVVEFIEEPADPEHFRDLLDAELARRNDDYRAHRSPGVGLPSPAVLIVRPGTFATWMRCRGRLGGQNKVPRIDSSGSQTRELVEFIQELNQATAVVPAGGLFSRSDSAAEKPTVAPIVP